MKNATLCEMFAKGATKGMGNNMHIEGDYIYSYNTVIGIRVKFLYGDHIRISTAKYSVTTSKHQTYLKRAAIANHNIVEEYTPKNYYLGR